MFKSIIVPVDPAHSDQAGAMLDVASQLADEGAKIVLVSVVEDLPMYVAAELPGGIVEKAREEAKKALEDIAAKAKMKCQTDVRAGQISRAILNAAEEHKADVIIIASHRPGLQDYLIGSTAGRVVRHATCSVHVMR